MEGVTYVNQVARIEGRTSSGAVILGYSGSRKGL